MVGVFVAMMVSVGSAAAVLTVLARRHAPDGGWRENLNAGVHAVRAKELPLMEELDPEVDPDAGVEDLFTLGETDPEPAYSEATAVRQALHRARKFVSHHEDEPGATAGEPVETQTDGPATVEAEASAEGTAQPETPVETPVRAARGAGLSRLFPRSRTAGPSSP